MKSYIERAGINTRIAHERETKRATKRATKTVKGDNVSSTNARSRDSHSQTPEEDTAAVRLKDGAAAVSSLPKERMRANEEPKTRSEIERSLEQWTKYQADLSADSPPGPKAKAERKIAELKQQLEDL